MNKKGFTLIELLVVISIIGILSSITLAALNISRNKAKIAAGQRFAASQYSAEGADSVLIYDFNAGSGTTVTDNSGNGRNAIIFGATWSTDTVTGQGSSMYFNGGSSSYTDTVYNSSFLVNNQRGFTYSVWIKPTAYTQPYNMFMGKSLPYFNVGGGSNNKKLHMSMSAGSIQRSVYGSTVIPLSEWHHVAATYDSAGYMKVYLDGKLDGTAGPYLNPTSSTVSNFFVGKWTNTTSYPFTGYIDDVRFYNHAIGIAEIQKIYAEGKSAHYLSLEK